MMDNASGLTVGMVLWIVTDLMGLRRAATEVFMK